MIRFLIRTFLEQTGDHDGQWWFEIFDTKQECTVVESQYHPSRLECLKYARESLETVQAEEGEK